MLDQTVEKLLEFASKAVEALLKDSGFMSLAGPKTTTSHDDEYIELYDA